MLDTLALARRCFSFPSNSLGRIAALLKLPQGGHRALGDALTTHALLCRFTQLLRTDNTMPTLGTLLAAQGGPIPWPKPRRIGVPSLQSELAKAVSAGHRLLLSYVSGDGDLTERLVDPSELVVGPGGNYLVGYCHLRQEQRTFKIERILRWECPAPEHGSIAPEHLDR